MIISQQQYNEHYKLYKGYVEKVENLLKKPSGTRAWSRDFNYAYAGARLHQLYFEHLDRAPKANERMLKMISQSFGSVQLWAQNLVDLANTCRPAGWALTCYNTYDKQLVNIAFDSHDGLIPDMIPLVVMDAYEHAYMIDFGVDKNSYFKRFIEALDWNLVWERFRAAQS